MLCDENTHRSRTDRKHQATNGSRCTIPPLTVEFADAASNRREECRSSTGDDT